MRYVIAFVFVLASVGAAAAEGLVHANFSPALIDLGSQSRSLRKLDFNAHGVIPAACTKNGYQCSKDSDCCSNKCYVPGAKVYGGICE